MNDENQILVRKRKKNTSKIEGDWKRRQKNDTEVGKKEKWVEKKIEKKEERIN